MDTADRPIDTDSLTFVVADVAVLVAILLYGQWSHGISVIADPTASLEGIVPFLLGWLVVSALAGLYTAGTESSVWRAARLTTVSWLGGANVGFVLRASPVFEGGITWPFPLVMTGIGLVALVGWRVAYAVAVGSR